MARADIVLEQTSTRVVEEFHVANGTNSDPSVEVDPSSADVDVGGGHLSSGGGQVSLWNHNDDEMARLTGSGTGGSLNLDSGTTQARVDLSAAKSGAIALEGGQGSGGVWIDAVNDNGRIHVFADNEAETVQVESYHGSEGGGRIEVRDLDERPQVTASAESNSGGLVTAWSEKGAPTCRLRGEDAALELNGPPERGNEDQVRRRFGGGELVINEGIDQPDIHLHATAERDSDYGLDAGHRPRIFLDGPAGKLEIGREAQGEQAQATSGEIYLRDRRDNRLLRARAGGIRAHSDQDAEIEFWTGDGDDQMFRGAIRSHDDGLMFYDSNNNKAMLIDTGGVIHTAHTIKQGNL